MKIVPIFAPQLYSIEYSKDESLVWNKSNKKYFSIEEYGNLDELARLFDLWNNPLYLSNFFNDNYKDLRYFGNVSVESAIQKTIETAAKFEQRLNKASKKNIGKHFMPLNVYDTKLINLSGSKTKCSWLRLYAIKIDSNRFLITGGAIKLTEKMLERSHTNDELTKLSKVRDFLKESGVYDSDSFNDLIFELSI